MSQRVRQPALYCYEIEHCTDDTAPGVDTATMGDDVPDGNKKDEKKAEIVSRL